LAEFKKVTKEQKLKYIKLNSGIDPEMEADYKDRVETGEAMLKYYFSNVAPTHDKGLKPLKVEIKFEVPIANPDSGEQDLWCKCDWCWRRFKRWAETNAEWMEGFTTWKGQWEEYRDNDWIGLPVTYGGRIDILFEDEQGRLWIGDWKTAARLSGTETSDEYLWNDDQITAYVWALRLIGFDVAGFIYAEIKKAVPEEPEPLKVTRLGRLFSVSKNINTTWEMYENTVKENDPNAYGSGLYTDFIEYLKTEGPQFHRRHMVTRNDEECVQAGINIWKEAKEMTNPDILIYPNQGRFHCKGLSAASGCAFWDPCLAKNRGEDVEYALNTMYQKLDRHYWETAEPTTDKRMEQL
jgi:hypothetical protein